MHCIVAVCCTAAAVVVVVASDDFAVTIPFGSHKHTTIDEHMHGIAALVSISISQNHNYNVEINIRYFMGYAFWF